MINIIALDTSTDACSVALHRDDGAVFSEFEVVPRAHTRYLPQMLDSVMTQAGLARQELNHVAFTNGPGAFTGVRIAAATAQGLAFGLNAGLLPVSTLAVLAQEYNLQSATCDIVAALDARMGETFVGHYRCVDGVMHPQQPERLVKLAELELPSGWAGVGSGFTAARLEGGASFDMDAIEESVFPSARALLHLALPIARQGGAVSLQAAGINYLRNRVAEKPRARTAP